MAGQESVVTAGQEIGAAEPEAELTEQADEAKTRKSETEKSEKTDDPWIDLIANPGRAPEFLAVAAVRTIGPRARDWATRTRTAYPTASNDALARLATQQFARAGRLGTLFGALSGPYAPAFLLVAGAIAQAELILHIAAAYGEDPTDPRRAADLLALGRKTAVHPIAAWAASRLARRYFPGTTLLAAVLQATADAQATAARAIAFYRKAATAR